MASFIRLSGIRLLNNNIIKTASSNYTKSLLSNPLTRCINTSSKPPQINNAKIEPVNTSSITPPPDIFKSNENTENWISYGMSDDDEWWDKFSMHVTFFVSISVVLVMGGALLAYMPDVHEYEWVQREAYLQLRYREANGLPLVDPDYVHPSKLLIPTDEELGDTEIII